MGRALRPGHDIEKMVDAITKIDIRLTAFGKHDFGARGSAVVPSVAGPVVGCPVGLRFYDHASGFFSIKMGHEKFAEQILGELNDVGVGVKRFFQSQGTESESVREARA